MVSRSFINKILGNVENPDVLDLLIDQIGQRWRPVTKNGNTIGITRMQELRSDAEMIAGIKIARAFTYLATRSYEGKPLVSGVMVVERWALKEQPSNLNPWILRFKEPIDFPVDSLPDMERLAQLADGRHSLLLTDTYGKLYGVVITEGGDFEVTAVYCGGGYTIVTTRNREVILFGGASPICHYNGFEWRSGIPREEVWEVAYWTWGEDIEEKGLEDVVYERSRAFVDLIQQLSESRISSIVAICDKLDFNKLKKSGVISPLRPELNNVEWSKFETPPWAYLNIFRLDGAHFMSKQFHLLSVCQKVLTQRPEGTGEMGTGKEAAQQLSQLLGESGYVIKVSADGPISVFRNGELCATSK